MRFFSDRHVLTRAAVIAQIAAALSVASVAQAQRSTTRGLSLGVVAQAISLEVENGEPSSGGGLGLRAGYGFNRIITGFIHLDGGEIDVPAGASLSGTWSLGHAELGARFHFANSLRRVVPYLETSLGARVVTVKDAESNGTGAGEVKFNGGALTVGGGVSTYVKPALALDVGVKFTGGTFTEVDLGTVALRSLDVEASSFRFGVGLTWWP
jgi:hypothetical protein